MTMKRDITVTTQQYHPFDWVLDSWMNPDSLRQWLCLEGMYVSGFQSPERLVWDAADSLDEQGFCVMKNRMGEGYAVFTWPGIRSLAHRLALPYVAESRVQITLGFNDYGVIQHVVHSCWPEDSSAEPVCRFFHEAWPQAIERQTRFLGSLKS